MVADGGGGGQFPGNHLIRQIRPSVFEAVHALDGSAVSLGRGSLGGAGLGRFPVAGRCTTCAPTGCLQCPVFGAFPFLRGFASLPVGLILDALLFGMPDFGLFMAAFPDEVALFGYQSYPYPNPMDLPSRTAVQPGKEGSAESRRYRREIWKDC